MFILFSYLIDVISRRLLDFLLLKDSLIELDQKLGKER